MERGSALGVSKKILGMFRKRPTDPSVPLGEDTAEGYADTGETRDREEYACAVLDLAGSAAGGRWGLSGIHRPLDLAHDPAIHIQRLPADETGKKKVSREKRRKLIALNKNVLVERIRIVRESEGSVWWYEDSDWKERATDSPTALLLEVAFDRVMEARDDLEPTDRMIYPIPVYASPDNETVTAGIVMIACTEDMLIASFSGQPTLTAMSVANMGALLDEAISRAELERASERLPVLLADLRNMEILSKSGMVPGIDRGDEDLLDRAVEEFPESSVFVPNQIRKKILREKALPTLIKWGSVGLLALVAIVAIGHYISVQREDVNRSSAKIQMLRQQEIRSKQLLNERAVLNAYISHPPDLGYLYKHLYMDSLVLKNRAFEVSVKQNSVTWRLSGVPISRTEFTQAKQFLKRSLKMDGGPKRILLEPNAAMSHVLVMEGVLNVE